MKTLSGAVAAVTGAGAGIGRALALDLAARGRDLALADVDGRGLAMTRELIGARVRVTTQQVDVADLGAMTSFRDAVERDFGRLSLLVNNAGVALYGRFDDLSLADLEWIVGINFWGAVYGCRLFLPLLAREREANIVTLSSVFGLVAPPMQTGYSAAKFAVRGFSESLRHELAPTRIRLTVVHPGGIKTEIAAKARRGAHADAARQFEDTKRFESTLVTAPERAATLIARAILADKPRLLIGGDAHVLDLAQRLFPARYLRVLAPLLDPKGRLARSASRATVAG